MAKGIIVYFPLNLMKIVEGVEDVPLC